MPTVSVILVSMAGCLAAGIGLVYFIRVAKTNQELAYSGDAVAAKRIILPCYRPLFRGLVLFYVCFAVCLGFSLFSSDKSFGLRGIVIYYCFCSLTVYSILPTLLLQRSVSFSAFWKTFYLISPWWLVCTVLWGMSFLDASSELPFQVLFLIISSLIPMGLTIGILTKVLHSRVQIGSTSNRNAVEILLVYSTIFGIVYTIDLACRNKTSSENVEYVMVSLTFATNLIFPFALYRTLLADTKYWRGLGKHNRGIATTDDLRESGVDIVRPTMEMSIVSSSFQEMMSDVSNISIDFAFLHLERLIGQGATSKVFAGKFKQKLVAIKLSTPAEITEDVIDVFVSEAKIAAQLNHPNIVRFVGICVRPPQIAMVFEFCEGGNLKTNLTKHPEKWTPLMRLRACSDCAKAVECLHQMGYIHRDLKAENFFVGHKGIVKLGDFGESTLVRNRESTATKRMTILGTVSFMAPEIIAASKYYTQSVDIYALAITFWEIWTGKEPYENVSQFDIYEKVGKGFRPALPDNAPERFNELLLSAWQQESSLRPSAKSVAAGMKEILTEFTKQRSGSEGGGDGNGSADGGSVKAASPKNGRASSGSVEELRGTTASSSSGGNSNSEGAAGAAVSGGSAAAEVLRSSVDEKTSDVETHNPMFRDGTNPPATSEAGVSSSCAEGASRETEEKMTKESDSNHSNSIINRSHSGGEGAEKESVSSVEMKEIGASSVEHQHD